ncbi:unnamed protein product [Phytophthora lilii]|uniref:Unnamed protein product n=1 Tax=Phytophthora lilii TaxID=2077276 RepID=A0A9W6WU94_9STRA|nr:unnamed protein product [Phytophthora lilii]
MIAANGLANMTISPADVHVREDIDGKYMEFFIKSCRLDYKRPRTLHGITGKEWRSTLWATAACTRKLQRFVHKSLGPPDLDQPYTIVEDFTKELYSNTARADVQVKQVVRRYVEADRDIIIWVARLTPAEIKHKMLRGLAYNLCGQVVVKRSPHSTPDQELAVLQQCSLIYLD